MKMDGYFIYIIASYAFAFSCIGWLLFSSIKRYKKEQAAWENEKNARNETTP